MTEQEAIDIIKNGCEDWKSVFDALAVAIGALEKQIPKKIVYKKSEGGRIDAYCPECGNVLCYENCAMSICECGQRLDCEE